MPLAERQVVDHDAGENMRAMAGAQGLIEAAVIRIPVAAEIIDLLAEGVADVKCEPLREPAIHCYLQRVIGRSPAIAP